MGSGRMHNLGDIHMVTNRCEEGAFFLLPTALINEIITYWLARAMCKFGRGLQIYCFFFLSNHFHLFCRDTEGTLAEFMEYFQGNVARAINRAIGRGPAHFWQGHYDDQLIDGEKTFWNKYVYIMTNAVKSGLVKRVEDWAGVNSFKAAVTGEPIRATGLNRTRYHNANRGNKKRPKSDFMETYEFHLTPPPMLEHLPEKEQRKEIYRMVKHAEVHYLSRRNAKPVLGMAKVLSFKPTHRPNLLERRPHGRFACDTVQREKELIEAYKSFIDEYKRTFSGFRRASLHGYPFHGEWPRGSFPPACHSPVIEDWAG
ncbi:MAG: hypothetical protein GY847_11375 [Proteobacteria bacterium]|nr:hypothetical protein [Pseudomonadota bacterium]